MRIQNNINYYSSFSKKITKKQWARIGTCRRSGIVVPLFSIHSKSSIGIGEIPDLKLLIDWCSKIGFSIIQLLPLYDTGNEIVPYSPVSSFALDPMYLSIEQLKEVDIEMYSREILRLRKKFPHSRKKVDYKIKTAKIKILKKIFFDLKSLHTDLEKFEENNRYWIYDYAVFMILAEKYRTPSWTSWGKMESTHDKDFLKKFYRLNTSEINFHIWLQWQLHKQLKDVKEHANNHGVYLMGDIPFLVSKNSADVWSHQKYFNLDYSAGAPPDRYLADGQNWGMPPYKWRSIKNDKFIYIKERLRSSEKYFDLYRIDHFIGLFRIWTIKSEKDFKNKAIGKFYPENENKWKAHGQNILKIMINSSEMLPCAEDLGTVPICSFITLKDFGIPGTDFQRFLKKNNKFIQSKNYRKNSISVISTHDSSFFINWWDFEAGSINSKLFETLCLSNGINKKQIRYLKSKLFKHIKSTHGRLYWKRNLTYKRFKLLLKDYGMISSLIKDIYLDSFDEKRRILEFLNIRNVSKRRLIFKALEIINNAPSIFSIQLLQEYLSLDPKLLRRINRFNYRINSPGTTNKNNWSIKIPIHLEKLNKLKINSVIYKMVLDTRRIKYE